MGRLSSQLAPGFAAAGLVGAVVSVSGLGGCAWSLAPQGDRSFEDTHGQGPGHGLSAPSPVPGHYSYFELPMDSDPWTTPISRWQQRVEAGSLQTHRRLFSLHPTRLSEAFSEFHRKQKRTLAANVTSWIQARSEEHFIPDGTVDQWPTFEETLAADGDDCDGLALVAYRMLQNLGFERGEIYQGIIRRDTDGLHHMVTLWFEDLRDPWIIDPTAAMATEMRRMSSFEDWRPLKLFTETQEYTVRPGWETAPIGTGPPTGTTAR